MKKLTYKSAIEELEEIVSRIENEETGIDELAEITRRATFLINYCRDFLKKTDDDVKRAISELEAKD